MTKDKQSDPVEIGRISEIESNLKNYLIHIRGNPARESLLIKELMDQGWSQTAIAKAMAVSQPTISKLLTLHNLIPPLFQRLVDEAICHTAAYQLANLPVLIQQELAKNTRITVRMAKLARREYVISDLLLDAMEAVNPYVDEKGDPTFNDSRLNTVYTGLVSVLEHLKTLKHPTLSDVKTSAIDDAIKKVEQLIAYLHG